MPLGDGAGHDSLRPVRAGVREGDVKITHARRLLWAMRLDRHHLLSWLSVLIPVVVLVLVPVVWVLETLFARGE